MNEALKLGFRIIAQLDVVPCSREPEQALHTLPGNALPASDTRGIAPAVVYEAQHEAAANAEVLRNLFDRQEFVDSRHAASIAGR
ncbi:MAG TPA: hypothetical protein VFA70_13765 [Dehalococcoidia bacterium]|nr:hypothetical protein [Dehalococcoidia bacterium]